MQRRDPGNCLICGAAHCSCGGGALEVVQLPARDAARLSPAGAPAGEGTTDGAVPRTATGQFTTRTYRGTKKRGLR